MQSKIKNFILRMCCMLMLATAILPAATPIVTYASNQTAQADNISVNELAEKGTSILNSWQADLTKVALAICPVAFIVLLIMILLTHNEKKLAGYMYLAGVIFVATLLIVLINNGLAVQIIQGLAQSLKN